MKTFVIVFDYLETLNWENISRVRKIRLWIPIDEWGFVDEKWNYSVV